MCEPISRCLRPRASSLRSDMVHTKCSVNLPCGCCWPQCLGVCHLVPRSTQDRQALQTAEYALLLESLLMLTLVGQCCHRCVPGARASTHSRMTGWCDCSVGAMCCDGSFAPLRQARLHASKMVLVGISNQTSTAFFTNMFS